MAPNFGQSSVTHKIGLASAEDIDAEVETWLDRAYEANLLSRKSPVHAHRALLIRELDQ